MDGAAFFSGGAPTMLFGPERCLEVVLSVEADALGCDVGIGFGCGVMMPALTIKLAANVLELSVLLTHLTAVWAYDSSYWWWLSSCSES